MTYSKSCLQHALTNNEFCYYYQPKVSLITGEVVGAEALLRWEQADTVLEPRKFMADIEQQGMLLPITLYLLPLLIKDINTFTTIMHKDFHVAVNVSATDLEQGEFIESLHQAVKDGKIAPSQLQIELTESALFSNKGRMQATLTKLAQTQICLVMDDFGTGFSSLELLHDIPFSLLKLDQSVVSRVIASAKCATIVRRSITMAHQLGMKTVAEGVDSAAIYDYLQHSGCSEGQGFWISPAVSSDDFIQFLHQGHQWSGNPVGLLYLVQLDHINWRKSLLEQALVFLFHKNVNVYTDVDHHQCKLGRWYEGVGQHFAHMPAYQALAQPHEQLHKVGSQLLQVCQQGISKPEAQLLITELSELSIEVLKQLQLLENSVLMSG